MGQTTIEEDVWRSYQAFLRVPPQLVVEWRDAESPARGWLVLNSLRGGAAGGGTRMRPGITREEVVFLAKVMELKFSVSGPPIGGAKSGLDFDPEDPGKRTVLTRWFKAIRPLLESCYATGGDLNVDEMREVAPLCVEVGLAHHQEGVARGHYGLEGDALRRQLARVRAGLTQPTHGDLGLAGTEMSVSDLVTGYGVAVAAVRLLEHQDRTPEGIRVLMEGFGSVGGATALFLTRWGARVVGIVDAHAAVSSELGLTAPEVEALLRGRTGNRLPVDPTSASSRAARTRFGSIAADVFICAAASGTVCAATLDRLEGQGVEAIVCGANHPFAAPQAGDLTLEREADRRFAVVADFVANCGTAHAAAYLMECRTSARPEEILGSVSEVIRRSVDEAVEGAGSYRRGLLGAAVASALRRISEPSRAERISQPSSLIKGPPGHEVLAQPSPAEDE